MVYRKKRIDYEKLKVWKHWIGQNHHHLESIGLPLAIYQDIEHWEDFLENGHLHWHIDGPPSDVKDLATENMKLLYIFLERNYFKQPPALLQMLKVRFG
ncbi:hypothetical protein [Leptospira santarosai]|uniref:Uncharacterized protein n=1 Tax=Leptospira santarosai serovar Shermani str. LT 821 TaxID=758847 RepID=K8XX92_9LEPT|nr:hypothetical protein [Leptospira santarosai]EKT86123.1 hypothetical protein LSS_14209 [Leptospira santarosai serovar Shermani str. LT 821]EPG84477.1 hypothetical protein LEP1GSC048_1175 [Leptospira santarosai serovar Shermani str. 1342KT]